MNRTIVFLLVLVLIVSACSGFPAQQVVSYQPQAIIMMQRAQNLAAFIAPTIEGAWAWSIVTIGAAPSLVMEQVKTVAIWDSLDDVIAHLNKLGYVRVPLEAAPAAVVTVEAALLCLRMIGTIPLMVPADQLHPFTQEGIDG